VGTGPALPASVIGTPPKKKTSSCIGAIEQDASSGAVSSS
jgi:hypothetical protein